MTPMFFTPKTIRKQIIMAFVICFVFMAAIIVVNYSNSRRLYRSMQLFELSGDLESTILEMRRYEKNYFLYRQNFNYEENLTYTNRLSLMLQRDREDLIAALGEENYDNFTTYASDYADQMSSLHHESCDPGECAELEAQIRGTGQNLNLLADQLITAERKGINQLLQQMMPLPLISLVVLVALMVFVIFFIGEKVIRPLARITRESEAVARGAFQRITAFGESENEIFQLITAINSMMAELERRQEQLIQSRKIASIGTLTAGIAHEINNPVNNLSLILESLIEHGEGMTEGERSKMHRDAMDQADRTSEIVKNLLEFSRSSHPRVEDVDLVEIVDKTNRLLRNEFDLHKIRFVKEVKTEFHRARLDKGGMQQVLLNLFVNSIQAMEDGGELRVIVGPGDAAHEVRLDIIDTGPGIPPEYLERVFDPFFTTKKEGEGTGLGLSVSYNIVEKNGGRMEVYNDPDSGAHFCIRLPLINDHGNGF